MLNASTLSPGLKKVFKHLTDMEKLHDLIKTSIGHPNSIMLVVIYIHRSDEGVRRAFF